MPVCDICERQKPEGTELVTRMGADAWVCHGCMMRAVTTKADRLTYREW